ncbi:thioredoxin-dependent thiol peroxidase [Pseudidiomarina sp. 1APP75-32.1]|uniref:thioredoxin-dependent peroxiredoxin n=1 Tax=Pseudidiomarina terrestris TaxID=2820060 RepID=A0AAW7QV12_9GAMM|nr:MULTISPECIES: thioredoxin-dependent thiol peroxidase [unclassified Pseudidiomarina]MDN7124100.1 thioredoxin-dependent thiol peroxidase [Pseudidiomarina sp. 1APP75-32.1]MDN7127172.1 thioredoxin-dependent thiol peroxidase [Pseudidiomarina sp. 1APR75-33.1]MDN7128357.1 thioredoxin-dependent thiol peroxidase [Pseudidiomarina sp. 1APR75-15]MDN7138553.1 thioredoxin-dependent thiol peroxidase [Pseudidiomarina sp. 1ASP75-14]MEA3586847.1 thioredoxin-dependent thiol peroxidase [Pseudidiomarina sp. 1AP
MNMLKVGDKAPQFTLRDANEQQVALTDLLKKGKVLIYFYPKAMTPGCTVQAQQLRDHQQELEKHDVVTVGISPDAPKRLAKFTERDELNFTLLSDEDHAVADAFGVWGPKKFMGREYDGIHRTSFLINQDGTVAEVFDKFKTKDHHQVVLDKLAES